MTAQRNPAPLTPLAEAEASYQRLREQYDDVVAEMNAAKRRRNALKPSVDAAFSLLENLRAEAEVDRRLGKLAPELRNEIELAAAAVEAMRSQYEAATDALGRASAGHGGNGPTFVMLGTSGRLLNGGPNVDAAEVSAARIAIEAADEELDEARARLTRATARRDAELRAIDEREAREAETITRTTQRSFARSMLRRLTGAPAS